MTRQPNLGREVFTYQVSAGADMQEVVSILSPDMVFEHGLCTEAIMGEVRADPAGRRELTPEAFRQNPAFVAFLWELISNQIFAVEGIRHAAQQQGEGFVYIIDARTPDPQGEVPPVDVIGGVEVQSGALVAGSYQHNPNHRLLTENGFFRLPDELESILQTDLRARCARPR